MVAFRDIQDVEEWLEPLDYPGFWEAIAPYRLALDDRDHWDGLIVGGIATTERLLDMLKFMAMMELRLLFGLKDRVTEPPVAKYLKSVH